MIVGEPRIAAIDTAAPVSSTRRIALCLCASAFLLAWLPRLNWGFWTDEAGTFWMAAEGWRQAIPRTLGWPGQSILYSLIESFFAVSGGAREFVLRVPSLVAVAIAAWQLRRIAMLLIGAEAGWIAVTALLVSPDVVMFGTAARPYALALAATLASMRYLLEWRKSPTVGNVVQYLIASVLVVHLHYLFSFVFVVQAIYLVFAKARGERLALNLPVAATIVLPLSLIPVVASLRTTASSGDFSYAQPPELLQLLWMCFPPVFLMGLGLGAVLLFASGRKATWHAPPVKSDAIVLGAAWLLMAPVAFFLVSRFTPRSIFAARYLLFVVPAAALFVAWAIAGLQKRESRSFLLIAVFAASVLHPGILVQNWRPSPSSWREPVEWIASKSATAPVFITSGLAHSSAADWRNEKPSTSQLYSALTAYPIPNRTIALPYEFGEPVKAFLQASPLEDNEQLLLAAADSGIVRWMSDWMKSRGYQVETNAVNDYVVLRFHR